MFLRFVHPQRIEQTSARRGFFSVAYDLTRDPNADPSVSKSIENHLVWFKSNLSIPKTFARTNSKGAFRREFTLGLSWFRHDAAIMLDRAWEMTAILREQGYVIDVIKSSRIGFVIYQDQHQVVAEPFKDTPV